MTRLIGYSILLGTLIAVISELLEAILFGESFSHALLDAVVLFIIITPVIYLIARQLLKLETERKALKEKEELIRLSTEHAVLYELSDQFMKTYDRDRIMDIAVKTIYEYFQADLVEIRIPNETEKNLILVSGIGWMPGHAGSAIVPVDIEKRTGYTFLKRRPVMIMDYSREDRFKMSELLLKHGVKSGMSVPMIATGMDGEKVIGVLGVHYKKPRKFISKDLWFLALMANETAIAIEKARLNEEIKSSKDFLNSVLEGIGEGVIVIDRDFRIVSANSAYINQEKPEAKVVGEHCYRISHNSEIACHEIGHDCPVLKTFKTGESASGIHTHYDSKGKASYMEVHSYPLRDPSGNVSLVVETITDVTERFELERKLVKSEEMYRDLYDNAPDMYFSIAPDETVIECNNTMSQILGYKKEELLGKHITLFSTTPPGELRRRLAIVKENGSLSNIEAQWKTKDNRIIDVILNVTAFYDKDGNYIFGRVSARDMTEKKKVETELKKKVKELEDFYNMAIDREMKMIELKKEIEKLKESASAEVPKDN